MIKLIAWNKGKENRGGQERRKFHLEGVMLHTASVKGMWLKFIKIYDSSSYSGRETRLKAQSTYFVLKNGENNQGILQ